MPTDLPPISGCAHPIRVYPGPDPDPPEVNVTPATIVGGESAWSDDDDSTYADFAPYELTSIDALAAQARADFSGYASTEDRTLQLQVRHRLAGPYRSPQWVVANSAITEFYGSWPLTVDDLGDGSIKWATSPDIVIPAGSDTSGGILVFLNVLPPAGQSSPVLAMQVFDLELCWASPVGPTSAPPLRLYPRPHPARQWPQSPTRQQGLRRGGSDIL